MKKIVIPTRTGQPVQPRPAASPDAPRPRLGLRYGADTEARARS